MKSFFKIVALIFLMTVILYACKQTNKQDHQFSFKDTVLKNYMMRMDSLARQDSTIFLFDSTEFNYKILKAYYNNDSEYLAQVKKNIESQRQYKYPENPLYKLHYPYLKNSMAEETYQFDFSETFCDYDYVITLAKKKDTINLHTVVFRLKRVSLDSNEIVLIKEFDKKLTQTNWEQIANAIAYADFWGLASFKEEGCCDGSSLRVDGITRNVFDLRITNVHSVQRRFVQGTAIFTAFKTAMQLAGLKNECE